MGAASAVWNFTTNREEFGEWVRFGSSGPHALSTFEAPAASLVLELNDGTNPAIVIPLNKFDYEYENQYPAGQPAISVYQPLTIAFDLTNSSPALFTAMARGKLFRQRIDQEVRRGPLGRGLVTQQCSYQIR